MKADISRSTAQAVVQRPNLKLISTPTISPSSDTADMSGKLLIVMSLLTLLGLNYYLSYEHPDFFFIAAEDRVDPISLFVWKAAFGISFFALCWRIWLVLTYRSITPVSDEELPALTVIIPAYNEGRHVHKTILSVATSRYPKEKVQIIGVDDGSRDDTWRWMQKAARKVGPRVSLIQQPVNKGKRQALYEGFKKATGEVLVTIDSDSLVDPDTLRHLVSPFVKDPKVGAVAGNVRVLNTEEGLIPKMMDVSFTFSFDFLRAGQSRINTVVCTPGALSSYRRSVVMDNLEEWLNQTFMGQPATIGEDRAFTNLILRSGYHVLFQKEAVVYTIVPTQYVPLCKMLLRWARSNVRETLVMCTFLFRKFRTTPALGARLDLTLSLFRMTVGEGLKLLSIFYMCTYPLLMSFNMVTGAAVISVAPAVVYFFRHKTTNFIYAFPYAVFWVISLSWISLYALCTPHKSKWLTRTLPQEPNPLTAIPTQRMIGLR